MPRLLSLGSANTKSGNETKTPPHRKSLMPRKDAVSHILAQGKQDAPLRLLKPEPDDTAAVSALADPRQYQAFTTGMKPPRLTIRPRCEPSRSPPYMALLDVMFDERFAQSASLIFTHMVVTITGKNLAGVVAAIRRHRATTIVEFDAETFDTPAGGVSVIERIEVDVGSIIEERIPPSKMD